MTKKSPEPPNGNTKPAVKPKATRKAKPKAVPPTAPVAPGLPPIAPAPAQQQATAPAPAPQAVPPTQQAADVTVPFTFQELNGIPPLDAAEKQRWNDERANAGFPPYMNPVAAAINSGQAPPATAHGDYQEAAPEPAPEPEPPQPVGPSEGELEAAIARYHELSDISKEIARKLAPTNDAIKTEQEAITAYLENAMAVLGTESIKTKAGTASTRTTEYVSVKDWDAVRDFIIQGGHYELLQKKVTTEPTKALLAEMAPRGEAIPGVEFGQKVALTISVPRKKAAK